MNRLACSSIRTDSVFGWEEASLLPRGRFRPRWEDALLPWEQTSSPRPVPPIASPDRESDGRQRNLERAHCEYLNVGYPPDFDRIAREQFDRAITRQMLLAPRRLRVARLLASGLDNKEIATRLSVSVDCVKKHVDVLTEKSEVDRRTKIALWFVGL
jgi:DNA-binding CsgD family transcriptional regulator